MRRSMWRLVVVGMLCAAGADAYAGQVPVTPPFALPDATAHKGVVDDSWVIAPRHLTHATLAAIKNYADEGDIAAGVSLRYHIEGADWIVADVFVYPAGQGDTARMLKQASEDFRESIAYAERQSIYKNIWWGEETPYTVVLHDGAKLAGLFLPLVFDAQEDMLTSRTYLFYRKLYFLKVRLSTTVEAVDSLAEIADGFVHDIADGLDIVSAGTCGRQFDLQLLPAGQTLPADMPDGVSQDGFRAMLRTQPGKTAYGTQMAKALALAAKRQRALGCTNLEYRPPTDDTERAVLHLGFGPDDWGASARP
ncbi:hypothetical protein EC912_102418 [Luteibacter rhizovicinus]|uniref:Uncharacterized protein n=1 Tax=Luteibacter rhizovicinus TaxID=242606 RepID=A0A4V2W4I5_9GAMM|nr:hypothetical protein [Luteibacter rhizovicinus]TCV96069.1 hypothetical protein EC912_102418 [Luteibacter rhizovicinus]